MFSLSEQERLVFEKIAPQFEKSGYEFLAVQDIRLPMDTHGYMPDFVARKGNEYIALEVKSRRTRAIQRSLENLKKVFESEPNWKFLYFFADEELEFEGLGKPEQRFIEKSIEEIRSATESGFTKAAFLLSWGLFEASARKAHSRIFQKPQTPGRIITILAERGTLTSDEAEALRRLSRKRNLIIHGCLEEEIVDRDVNCVLDAALIILKETAP